MTDLKASRTNAPRVNSIANWPNVVQMEKLKKVCSMQSEGATYGDINCSLSLSRADFEWEKMGQQCLQSNTGDAISEVHEI